MASQKALSNWTELNKALMTLSEEGCASLLRTECKGKRRQAFMLRIHGRFNVLRAQRERAELLQVKKVLTGE